MIKNILKPYYMSLTGLFNRKRAWQESPDTKGGFASFILLSDASFDFDLIINNLKEIWGISIPVCDIDKDGKRVATKLDGMRVYIFPIPFPIPNGLAEQDAKTNWRWSEAINVAKAHKAQIMAAVIPIKKRHFLKAAITHVKICASCLNQPNATAISTLRSVLSPDFYIASAKAFLDKNSFPVLNLVFFGMYSNDNGKTTCGYTYGMDVFGKKNIEIINSTRKLSKVHDFMVNVASYVIESNATLRDGDKLDIDAGKREYSITESAGVVPTGTTVKINY